MGAFEDVLEQSSQRPRGPAPFLARSKQSHQSTRRTSCTDANDTLWDLELHPLSDLESVGQEIEKLSIRALDTNVFFEPAAIESFWPRMRYRQKIREPLLLCLYQHNSGERTLRFFAPVGTTKVGLPARRVLQVLATEYFPDGTPLLDKMIPAETCQILFQALCDPALLVPDVVDFRLIRGDSPTARHLSTAAQALGLNTQKNQSHMRACLSKVPCNITKKRQKEYARQLRRLGDRGGLTFQSISSRSQIIDAFEEHLALELSGWKGRRGTALYNNRASVGFSRHLVSQLARANACEIIRLNLGGSPIASLVMLGSDSHILTWKIAYDETLAAFSPGVQLMLHVTEQLQNRENFEFADSLAVADHPMINHLWQERISVADWMVALNESAKKDLAKAIAAKNRYEKLRAPLSYLRRKFEKRY